MNPGSGLETIVFVIIGIAVVGVLVSVGKGISQWNFNNSQPVLTVPAKVVGKRAHVGRRHHHHDDHVHHHSRTTYFATFELECGERMEFQIAEDVFGLLAEGDRGDLTYQGTRYQGFARQTVAVG